MATKKRFKATLLALGAALALAGCTPPVNSGSASVSEGSSVQSGSSTGSSQAEELYAPTVEEGILHGKVHLSRTGALPVGTEVRILAEPEEGYEVKGYTLNGEPLPSDTFLIQAGLNVAGATFKEKAPVTEYGSVVVTSEDPNGTIAAYAGDTLIERDNRRQIVGTKIKVVSTPIDETYQLSSLTLNGEEVPFDPATGTYEFEVVKGKNYIGGAFSIARPGEGLIRLSGGEHAEVTLSHEGEYVPVGTEIQLSIVPDSGFTVKGVTLNGTALEGTDGEYLFPAVEGMNLVHVEVVPSAEAISILPAEELVLDEDYTYYDRYLAVVGESYQLSVSYEPEGSFAPVRWEVPSYDQEYVTVDENGLLTVLAPYGSGVTVTASVEGNDSVYDTISIVPISESESLLREVYSAMRTAIEVEPEVSPRSEIRIESKGADEEKASGTTYSFESYEDGHSITTARSDGGAIEYFYRGILDNTYYTLHKDGTGALSVIDDPEAVPSSSREEYERKVNAWGAIEIEGDYGMRETYEGVSGYIMEKALAIFDYTDYQKDEYVESAEVEKTWDGYSIHLEFGDDSIWESYTVIDVELRFYTDGRLYEASYSRYDYEDVSTAEAITEDTPYSYEGATASTESGERGVDESGLFSIDDCFYDSFSVGLFRDDEDLEGSRIALGEDGYYEVYNSETIYLFLEDGKPGTALPGIDVPEFSLESEDLSFTVSEAYGTDGYYFRSYQSGEGTITVKTKDAEPVTIKIRVVDRPVESVYWYDELPSSLYVGEEIELDARITPTEGIADTGVTYSIDKGVTEASLYEKTDDRGYSDGWFLKAGNVPGTVTITATSNADPSKSITHTIEIKAVPDMSSELSGATLNGTFSESDWGSGITFDIAYEITFSEFAEGVADFTLTLKGTETYEDPYGWGAEPEVTEIDLVYSGKATLSGLVLSLGEVTEAGDGDLSLCPVTMTVLLGEGESFGGLSFVRVVEGGYVSEEYEIVLTKEAL